MTNHDYEAELGPLLQQMLSDEADHAQLVELQERLEHDAQLRAWLFDSLETAALLRWQYAPYSLSLASLPSAADAAAPALRRRLPRGRLSASPQLLSLTVAALFVTVVLLSMALWTLPTWRPAEAPTFDRTHIVAEVIRSRDVRWAPESLDRGKPPIDLLVGRPVELLAGAVAVRFDSGAIVWLEGPVAFTPQGKNRLQLHNGKLAARVPERAVGFLVHTPTVDVLDLGTEFAVEAGETETEVHVLTGQVEVQRISDDARPMSRILTAGQAAVFGNSSDSFYVQEKPMNRSIFLGMAALLATADSSPSAADGAPLAEDNFFVGQSGYTTGTIHTQNPTVPVTTGFGSNAWTANGAYQVNGGQLSYITGNQQLVTSPGQLVLSGSQSAAEARRNLSGVQTPAGQYYISMLVQMSPGAELKVTMHTSLADSGGGDSDINYRPFSWGVGANGNAFVESFYYGLTTPPGTNTNHRKESENPVSFGQPQLWVIRVADDLNPDPFPGDVLELYLNPTLGEPLGTPVANISTGNFFVSGWHLRDLIFQGTLDENSSIIIDEFRIGSTLGDVMPFQQVGPPPVIPEVSTWLLSTTGSLGAILLLRCRRRVKRSRSRGE